MKILALDISKKCTGWAVDNAGGPPLFGSYDATADMTPGMALVAFSRWLKVKTDQLEPNMIAIEQPIYSSPRKAIAVTGDTSILIMMAGMAMAHAAEFNMLFGSYSALKVRKHFVWQASPKNPKQVVYDRCKLLCWYAKNFDESDALAVWCYAKAINDRGFRPETGTPLFRGGNGQSNTSAGV